VRGRLATAAAVAWTVLASARGETANTVITSDRLSVDYKRSMAVFEDNVVVVDPQLRLEADQLTVLLDGTNEIKSVTAVGRVRLASGEITGTCQRAVYLTRQAEVVMTGNVALRRGKESLSAEKITVWLNEDRISCEKRTKVVIESDRSGGMVPAGGLLPTRGGEAGAGGR